MQSGTATPAGMRIGEINGDMQDVAGQSGDVSATVELARAEAFP